MGDRLKLLFVAQLHPWPLTNGGAVRVFNLLAGLVQRHRVTLVVLAEAGKVVDESFPLWRQCEQVISVSRATCAVARTRRFDDWPPVRQLLANLFRSPLPSFVRRWESAELVKTLRALRATNDFDAVWVERSYIAESVRAAGFRGRIVVDVDDLENVVFLRKLRLKPWYRSKPLHYAEWAKANLYERLLPLRFWRLVVCKEDDRRFFGPWARGDKVRVVPNGVAADAECDAAGEVDGEMVFVGALNFPPNMDAVRHFVTEILPRIKALYPAARFVAVGSNPAPEILKLHNGSDCVIAASVPDVRPYLNRAAVAVVPLRVGGGTRLKVLEALGCGRAVVSTTLGAEGLGLQTGVHLELADSPDAFAAACVRLLRDPELRRRLGRVGRERVLRDYRWDAIAERADAVLVH